MSDPRLPLDPQGYYARLGVVPTCPPDELSAAYRRAARLVHPDVPGTGNAAAFLALKEAYDVLNDPERRASYDRSAPRPGFMDRDPARDPARDPVGARENRWDTWPEEAASEIDPAPHPAMNVPPARHPRLRDLPVSVWISLAVLLLVGLIEAGLHLSAAPVPAPPSIPPLARDVPPPTQADPPPATFGAAPVRLAGSPNLYVSPNARPVTLWRLDDQRHGLVPWGELPPFSGVQGLRVLKQIGMVEVRVTEIANGFVESARLTPGNAAAAATAWCLYHAGPAPVDGEVLSRTATGSGTVKLENRAAEPMVVKLRTSEDIVAASVFLAPGGAVTLEKLREEPVHVEFATGVAWSRACHGFTGGMRAQRLGQAVTIGQTRGVIVPPEAGAEVEDLPDISFERE